MTTVRLCAIIMPQRWVTTVVDIRAQYGLSCYHIFFYLSTVFGFSQTKFCRIFSFPVQNKQLTNPLPCIIIIRHLRECWNGRQARLRCVWLRRVGSSPISRTKLQPPRIFVRGGFLRFSLIPDYICRFFVSQNSDTFTRFQEVLLQNGCKNGNGLATASPVLPYPHPRVKM